MLILVGVPLNNYVLLPRLLDDRYRCTFGYLLREHLPRCIMLETSGLSSPWSRRLNVQRQKNFTGIQKLDFKCSHNSIVHRNIARLSLLSREHGNTESMNKVRTESVVRVENQMVTWTHPSSSLKTSSTWAYLGPGRSQSICMDELEWKQN